MKYTVNLNNTKYVVEIEDSIATIVDKVCEKNTQHLDSESDDFYDVPDFDFSDNDSPALKNIEAQLPGVVIQVCVENGQTVKKGDVLLVIESMKMENSISAEQDCKVQKMLVKIGDYIKKGQVLLTIEPLREEDKL